MPERSKKKKRPDPRQVTRLREKRKKTRDKRQWGERICTAFRSVHWDAGSVAPKGLLLLSEEDLFSLPIPPKRPPLEPALGLEKALERSFGCCLESELVFFFSAYVLFVL